MRISIVVRTCTTPFGHVTRWRGLAVRIQEGTWSLRWVLLRWWITEVQKTQLGPKTKNGGWLEFHVVELGPRWHKDEDRDEFLYAERNRSINSRHIEDAERQNCGGTNWYRVLLSRSSIHYCNISINPLINLKNVDLISDGIPLVHFLCQCTYSYLYDPIYSM